MDVRLALSRQGASRNETGDRSVSGGGNITCRGRVTGGSLQVFRCAALRTIWMVIPIIAKTQVVDALGSIVGEGEPKVNELADYLRDDGYSQLIRCILNH